MEDERIVELYWQRDESAIEITAGKYGSYLNKVAYNILGDPEDSMESVNDTYLSAWNAMPPHRPQALCAFLSKLTRRISIDLLRKKQSVKRGGGEYELSLSELEMCLSAGNTTEETVEGRALTEAIGKFLLTLSEKARNAFIGRYFYMDPIAEVARYCGMTQSNTKVLLHRTRLALRTYLEQEGYL